MGLIRRIAQLKPTQRQRPLNTRGEAGDCFEESINDLTLESIRDLIIEAYGCIDKKRRSSLLEKSARLEKQLVAAYRAKGLKSTAENIIKSLNLHRKQQRKRSS